jgi:hypothetical protein
MLLQRRDQISISGGKLISANATLNPLDNICTKASKILKHFLIFLL